MYVEKKNGRYGVFYVLRMKESEVDEGISDIENLINRSVKEEYRDEFKDGTIRIIRKCKHDEKYDKDGEVSYVLKDNDTWDFLHVAFNLLSCGGSAIADVYETIDVYERIVETYKGALDVFTEHGELKSELDKLKGDDISDEIDDIPDEFLDESESD